MTRIGLFGGSFNPPHRAHRALAEQALQALQLDQLLVMPAGRPWQKASQALAAGAHRFAMAELQMRGLAGVEVSRLEIERDEPSTTAATLERLRACFPGAEWFVVIGQDQYGSLSSWKRLDEWLPSTTLAVAARAGAQVQADPALPAHRMQRLALPADPISSSEVRAALSRGTDITPMVGPEVAGYIAHHHLYGL